MDAGEHRDLCAAVKLENERTGEVQGEVDLTGRDRLAQERSGIGDDIVDLRDALGREQFINDILRHDAETRNLGEPDPRCFGRGFLRLRAAASSAPNQPCARRRAGGEKKITPVGQHWRLPLHGTRAFRPTPTRRRLAITAFI